MRRKASTPLTRGRLVAEALKIVDEQGFEALSMRRLAVALGVDPMAAYYHVANKQALVRLMVESVFSGLHVPKPQGDWRDRVRSWAENYRAVAMAHPNLVLQIVTDIETVGAAAVHANEELFSALEAGGLAPDEIVEGAALLVDFINGYVLGVAPVASQAPEDPVLRELEKRLGEDFPVQRRIMRTAAPLQPSTYFAHAIDIITAGLAAPTPGQIS